MNDFFRRYKTLAVLGLSRNPKSFSRQAWSFLRSKGYKLYPVNPNADTIDGVRCYPSVEELPEVQAAIFFTPPQTTGQLLPQLKAKGIEHVWFQQGSADKAALQAAQRLGLEYVDSCVFLHHPESGFPHNVHRFIANLFGRDQVPAGR